MISITFIFIIVKRFPDRSRINRIESFPSLTVEKAKKHAQALIIQGFYVFLYGRKLGHIKISLLIKFLNFANESIVKPRCATSIPIDL